MQRIRQQKQTVALESLGREHRRRSATHRPAANDQRLRRKPISRSRDHCGKTLLQSRHWVRSSGSLFLVKEVETHDAESAITKDIRGLNEPAIIHVSAGAVGANENHALIRPDGRRFENGRGFLTPHRHSPLTTDRDALLAVHLLPFTL
jgi:hypothetical protein